MILEWVGPFDPCDPSRDSLRPPQEAGVYLWVIETQDGWMVTYVGETGNLAKRCYDHVVGTLGGGYWLYDTNVLKEGKLEPQYQPNPAEFNTEFTKDHPFTSKLAFDNLRAYRICWARFDRDVGTRKAVEHALIWRFTGLKDRGRPEGQLLQNGRRYHWPEPLRGKRVESVIIEGPKILGLRDGLLLEEGLDPNG